MAPTAVYSIPICPRPRNYRSLLRKCAGEGGRVLTSDVYWPRFRRPGPARRKSSSTRPGPSKIFLPLCGENVFSPKQRARPDPARPATENCRPDPVWPATGNCRPEPARARTPLVLTRKNATYLRSIYLSFKEDVKWKGIDGYRFALPEQVMNTSLPQNLGYCNPKGKRFYSDKVQPGTCLPPGLLDISRCQQGNNFAFEFCSRV